MINAFRLALAAALFMAVAADLGAQEKYRFVSHADKGGPKAQPGDFIEVDIYVYFRDSLIQSTRTQQGRPAAFTLPTTEQLAAEPANGMLLALFKMGVGDSLSLFERIDSTTPPLPDFYRSEKEIRLDLSLKSRKTAEDIAYENAARMAQAQKMSERLPAIRTETAKVIEGLASGAHGQNLKTTASGLQYIVSESGAGETVKAGERIEVHYFGALRKTGESFDNSFSRGEALPLTVGVGQVISGWDEGLQLFRHGGKGWLIIPAALGYGEQDMGIIPPNSDLLFYVEIQ